MSIFKMMRVDGHDYVDLSWKVFKEVIEIETGLKDREIQQKLIDMGWTPPPRKEKKPMNIYTKDLEEYTYGWQTPPAVVPSVVFKTRVRDESIAGNNPYCWQDVNTFELFGGKKVLLFSLPGAFTPTCDTMQLPTFESLAPDFYSLGFDEIYCISVNDAFVMNKWADSQDLKYVKVIPDGNGEFTRLMRMEVSKENLGFGDRSWRYALVANNGTITDMFIEDGKDSNIKEDPYVYTDPEFILETLRDQA